MTVRLIGALEITHHAQDLSTAARATRAARGRPRATRAIHRIAELVAAQLALGEAGRQHVRARAANRTRATTAQCAAVRTRQREIRSPCLPVLSLARSANAAHLRVGVAPT